MKKITVLLVDDHTVVREGLRLLLEAEKDIEVIAEADSGREAVKLAHKLKPRVVVMDIAMPRLNGLEAARQMRKDHPEARILMLSAHDDEGYVEQVMTIGAAGYLLKHTSAHILIEAVRAIEKGGTYFSPAIAKRLRDPRGPVPDHGQRENRKGARLTSREVEVLQLIAEGRPNKQVAAELGISVKTVEKHRQSLMERLSIHDTAGLTRYAISSGIIENSVQLTVVPEPV